MGKVRSYYSGRLIVPMLKEPTMNFYRIQFRGWEQFFGLSNISGAADANRT